MADSSMVRGSHTSKELLARFQALRQAGAFLDMTLTADGEGEIRAHRLLLAACSPYFDRMLSPGGFAESTGGVVNVGGVHVDHLSSLVDYMYTGDLGVDDESAPGLLAAADLLLMDRVKASVCGYLRRGLSAASCVFVWRLADVYSCANLCAAARGFIARNFEFVSRTDEFLELGLKEVEMFLKMDAVFVRSEDTVAEAVLSYCARHGNQHLDSLLTCVRKKRLSRGWIQRLTGHPEVSKQAETVAQLEEAGKAAAEVGLPRGLNKLLVAVGFDSCVVEHLDLDQPEAGWGRLTEVPGMRYGMSGAGLAAWGGDTLLVTGGVGRAGVLKALPRFLVYSLRTNEWVEGPDMARPRKCHGCAVVGDRLYVVGGSDSQLSVMTGEWLDLSRPREEWAWRDLPAGPLPAWHNGPAVSQHGSGKIFLPAAYGADNDKIYDTAADAWRPWDAAPPSDNAGEEAGQREQRDRPGVGGLGDEVYLVGGAGSRRLLDIVESWSAESGRWVRRARLHLAREGPGVAGYGGLLYAVGGRGSTGSVERYSREHDTWELLEQDVGYKDQEYCAVVLDRVI